MDKNIVDDLNFKDEVLNETMPLMVDFFATWCKHCKDLEPIINDIHKKYVDKVKFVMADIDETPHYTEVMAVKTTPTLFFYKDGKMLKKIPGPRTKEMIEEALKTLA